MSQPLEVTDPADAKEKAEWDKAAEYMLGGKDPDAEPEQEAESHEDDVLEFKYRGKTLRVDREQYEVLEGLRREARGANGRLGSELARTRERLARMEATLAAREERPAREDDSDLERLKPDPILATRDIAAWQQQYDSYRDAKEARRIEKLEQRYIADVTRSQEQAREASRTQAWADRFYSTHDHLDDPAIKPIVTQAYIENKHEIDSYGDDVEAAHERLAELADERLVRLKKAGRQIDPDPKTDNRRRLPTFESSARATPRAAKEDDGESRRNFSAASWSARERLKMGGKTPPKER